MIGWHVNKVRISLKILYSNFLFIHHEAEVGIIHDLADFDSHTVFIKVCNTPHKTKFRRNKPPKFAPLKLEIYLNYAFSLDLCCNNIVWTLTCFNSVSMYG